MTTVYLTSVIRKRVVARRLLSDTGSFSLRADVRFWSDYRRTSIPKLYDSTRAREYTRRTINNRRVFVGRNARLRRLI